MTSVTVLTAHHFLSLTSPPIYKIRISSNPYLRYSIPYRPIRSYRLRPRVFVAAGGRPDAYISAPGSDAIVTESELNVSDSEEGTSKHLNAVSWGLLWQLIGRHKLRLAVSVFSLVGCTACTLSMPIFSGSRNVYTLEF